MRNELLTACQRFISNRDAFKEAGKWENSMIYPVCAGVVQPKNRFVTPDEIKECKKMIKENTGVFSYFRGTVRLPIIAMLVSEFDSEKKLKSILEAYSALKNYFFADESLTLSAIAMTKVTDPLHYDETAQRAKNIYKLIKKKHPILTSVDDSAFCVMLTLSKRSDEEIAEEIEKCYITLKNEFLYSDGVLSLSLIMALCEEMSVETKCGRALELYNALRSRGIKYSRSDYLPTLGAIAVTDADISQTADDIKEVYDYLKTQKGYGFFSSSKQERALHALMIVAAQTAQMNTELGISSVISTVLVIAAQVAACVASTAAVAAANASS
ncbi:MAG: DUF4003 family protein [Acutalibacteraceae bacterium]